MFKRSTNFHGNPTGIIFPRIVKPRSEDSLSCPPIFEEKKYNTSLYRKKPRISINYDFKECTNNTEIKQEKLSKAGFVFVMFDILYNVNSSFVWSTVKTV